MNKTYTKSLAPEVPQAYESKKSAIMEESTTLSLLISQLDEEVSRGFGNYYNTTNEIDRLLGSVPQDEMKAKEAYEPAGYLDQLSGLVVKLRILNNRTEDQYYRLRSFIG